MKKILHTADSRGHANHGWLDAHHSFSFAGYYDPQRMHFGVLRVLNDDRVAPGMGFGMHPHDNMEIITIALEGALKHKDNMGNEGIIRPGDVQVMSAGTGVVHSEFNPSKDEAVNLLQIWVIPKERNVKPRYDQKHFDSAARRNSLQLVVAPDDKDGALWIHQDAWFSLGQLDAGKTLTYQNRKTGNGSYIFVINGEISVDGERVGQRDGIGLTNFDTATIEAKADAEFLIMDVPQS
jgi:quercetin 2,3-dioxygenase